MATREEKETARAKARAIGGTGGDSGALAEASANEAQRPGNPIADTPPDPTHSAERTTDGIPPDQQERNAGAESSDPIGKTMASLSTAELKDSWATMRGVIDRIETEAADRKISLRTIEQELCERYKKVADAQGAEAIVVIAGRRMKVKARQARIGGGLGLVDAPVNAAIEL